ncbi:unnamed protein product [Owenia fusiformis]|uniref:Uncharacterized protein n=2 Tax=Owenia fusiformis TaxID=6347 RepID=A0A8S4PW51_OWEFU|nr:unnamed protein product [Owenia fusiformis]
MRIWNYLKNVSVLKNKPKSSEVLTNYLKQRNLPLWTAFVIKYSAIKNDQFGLSHFNWNVDGTNYHVLRTGCFPYVKYHCTKRPYSTDLISEDRFYRFLKIINLGLPTLTYGIAHVMFATHHETVKTSLGCVTLYFWYPEDRGATH